MKGIHPSLLSKIKSPEALSLACAEWRKQGHRIVFTNGVFDLLHTGHVSYLAEAAALGDKLIIGLNDDDSVRALEKGVERPINNQQSRAAVLAALESVAAVVIFSEKTPIILIEHIKPDVLVKGGDYDATCQDQRDSRYIVGSKEVKDRGGEVQSITFVPGYSSTSMIKKIRGGNED